MTFSNLPHARTCRRPCGLGAVVFAVFLMLATGAQAADEGDPVYDTPVYFPATKSYYELAHGLQGEGVYGHDSLAWSQAKAKAEKRVFKGTRGRLALVKSRELDTFLRETFRPDQPTWIGLRYWCGYNKLQWVNGDMFDRRGFSNWDINWNVAGGSSFNQTLMTCSGMDAYWPVHYWPVQEGFRWNANNSPKAFYNLFIEYPTGKP